jgi:TRAP transporter 4TM/12TM fusion protein
VDVRTPVAVAVISVCWTLFQLALPSVLILDSIKVRAIHLAFAMVLLFLTVPTATGLPRVFGRALDRLALPGARYVVAGFAALSALYLMLDWEGIATRSGLPNARDLVFGAVVILFVLEAARRSVGPALPIIALAFVAYAFAGPYLPSLLAFKGVSFGKLVTQVTLSSEGIYGIPLGVSARIVFLFVLTGAVLEKGGAGRFFIRMALSLLGRFRGGPAKAAVVASGLLGSISGSSIANVVTTGTFTIPFMKKVGYPAKKAAAIEVAASTNGQLMPPIMGAAAFIIAEYVGVSYLEVVKAAAIPAFVSYCALFYITHLEACKLGLKGLARENVPDFWATVRDGWHFLLPPVLLIVQLLFLRRSAEKSIFAAICVLVPVTVYEQFRLARHSGRNALSDVLRRSARVLVDGSVAGCRNMVGVALATAAAGIVVGIVNMGIGSMITQVVETLSGGNVFALLLITAVASLILGMGLPTTATYIVMAALTAPILVLVGGRHGLEIPLIAAHLFCFYFGILADDTPPVGLAAYAAAAVAESEPIPTGVQGFLYDLRTTIIPFMFIFNSRLILSGVDSWLHGLWIFLAAVVAACMFTAAVQGWFLRRNRWFEVPLLLAGAALLFHPDLLRPLLPAGGNAIPGYAAGIAFFGLALLSQKLVADTARA